MIGATQPAREVPELRAQNGCFACGAENPQGLHLCFETAPDGSVATSWQPAPVFQGFEGVIHGGLIATVLDEAMAKAVLASGLKAVTCELSVRFRRHIVPGEKLLIRGWVTTRQKRKLTCEAILSGEDGQERAHASGIFLLPLADAGTTEPRASASG